MVAIQELPEVRRRVARLSIEDYPRLTQFNGNGRPAERSMGFIQRDFSTGPQPSPY